MTELNLLAGLNEVVEEVVKIEGVDHNEESSGGGGSFERVVLEDGIYPCYPVMYVELGTQLFKGFQGAKDTKSKAVRVGFAVFDFDNVDEEGNPRYTVIDTGYTPMKLSQNPKAKFFKLQKALNWNNDPQMNHMAKFLGSAHTYEVKVEKGVSKKGTEYNKLLLETLVPAFTGGRGASRVRETLPEIPLTEYSILLWNNPRQDHWDSIRRGKEGTSPTDERNFLQYECLQALDFDGSALDLMLREQGLDTKVKPKSKPEPEYDEEMPEDFDEPVQEKVKVDTDAPMPVMPDMED